MYNMKQTNRNLCVEVMVVKKKVTIAFVITGILAISTMIIFSTYKSSEAYRKAKAKTQWECSVVCAEKSTPDSYVITYSDAKILSNTGVLTVQNRNDFDITVHRKRLNFRHGYKNPRPHFCNRSTLIIHI